MLLCRGLNAKTLFGWEQNTEAICARFRTKGLPIGLQIYI